jgi:hypothetical protein
VFSSATAITELQLPVLCLSNESTNLFCSARNLDRLCCRRRKKLCVLSSFTFRPAHLHTCNETLTLTRYELKYITIGANSLTQLQKQAVPSRVTLLTSRHCQWQTLRNSPLLPVRRVVAVILGVCCRSDLYNLRLALLNCDKSATLRFFLFLSMQLWR